MTPKLPAALFSAILTLASISASAESPKAAPLRARFSAIGDSLKNNQFKRPIFMESAESNGALKGDVYALVEHPYSTVSAALTGAAPWCDIMIMPVNTKDCRIAQKGGATTLTLRIGRKYDQPIKDAYPIEFTYKVAEASADYFAVRINADSGPLSTHDYRVLVEATPAEEGKAFLHLRYSYGYGMAGRIAMQAYLATAGAGKVGFSTAGNDLVGGMRGVIERNTMRYYLAIDAYLNATGTPSAQRLEKRLATWFDSTEQYKRQLHEIDRDAYLAMKRKEARRQQTAVDSTSEGQGRL